MATLTSKQRAFLRALAHPLKPVVLVGTEGVSEALLVSLSEAFHTRELLKVKVLEGAPQDPRETAALLVGAKPDVQVPQIIGRTIVLFRPFPDTPSIILP